MFTLAILGRPNVGKSTLFNRLTGTPFALVDDAPGVTRDRREGKGRIGPLEFTLFDTAGLEQARAGTLAARMTGQSEQALEECDVALLLIDGRAGLTAEDKHFAGLARKSGKPVVLVVNKCEGGKGTDTVAEAYGLGLGEPVALSAAHGDGLSDLYDALSRFDDRPETDDSDQPDTHSMSRRKRERTEKAYAQKLHTRQAETVGPEDEDELADLASNDLPSADFPSDDHVPEETGPPPPLQIAIVGRPNAGKSTLFNRLLGFERTLTGPEAGITRDAIAVDFTYGDRALKLVDTAGMRRRANVTAKVEKLAVDDSRRAIQYAGVVILVLDAESALEKQDLTLAGHIEKEGRGLVVALNKWDKVADKQRYLTDTYMRLEDVMPQVKGVIVQPISADRGTHIDKLMEAVFTVYEKWNRRIPTRRLNTWLEDALMRHSPPVVNGRRIKLRYMTQIKTRPPTFALFTSKTEKLPDSYLRYLVNSLRDAFDLPGIPIRILLKRNKNPYIDK